MDAEKNCPICAKPLPISKTRPIVYCSEACKQKAKRRRKTLTTPKQPKKTRLVNVLKPNQPVIKTETIIGVSGTVHRVPVGATGIEQAPTLVQKERSARQTFEEVKRLLDGYYD